MYLDRGIYLVYASSQPGYHSGVITVHKKKKKKKNQTADFNALCFHIANCQSCLSCCFIVGSPGELLVCYVVKCAPKKSIV